MEYSTINNQNMEQSWSIEDFDNIEDFLKEYIEDLGNNIVNEKLSDEDIEKLIEYIKEEV